LCCDPPTPALEPPSSRKKMAPPGSAASGSFRNLGLGLRYRAHAVSEVGLYLGATLLQLKPE
jgi:hypothetical protein